MHGWTITLHFAGTTPVHGDPEDLAEDLLDELLDHGAVVTIAPGRYCVTLSIDGTLSETAAIDKAKVIVANAARDVGWPTWPLVHAEAMTYAEHDRLLALPAFPELAGVAELAEALGVSSQRVSTLRHRDGFPAPVAELRSGPVWRLADITRFTQEWDRKPGRPRRVS
jgi:hypothetical protein